MIISHKHKFVFIHVHRTAGTTIAKSLIPLLDESDEIFGYTKLGESKSEENRQKNLQTNNNEQGKNPWKHSTPKHIKQYLGSKKWNEYFKFATVRNPLDVHFSNYHYLRNPELHASSADDVLAKVDSATKNSFSNFLLTVDSWQYTLCDFTTSLNYKNLAKSPYKEGRGISNYNTDLDFLMRFEQLKLDFSYFCGLMNLPKLKLDWLNKSRPLENRKMGFDEICKNEKCLNFLDKRHKYDYNYFEYSSGYDEHVAKHDVYNW